MYIKEKFRCHSETLFFGMLSFVCTPVAENICAWPKSSGECSCKA